MTDWNSWLDLEFAGRTQKVRLSTVDQAHRLLFDEAVSEQNLPWESMSTERALVEVIMEEDFGPDPICDEWPLITLGLFLQHSSFVDMWLRSYEGYCRKRLNEVPDCVALNGGALVVPVSEEEFLPSLRDTISAFLELVSDVAPGTSQADWIQTRLQRRTIPVPLDTLLGLDDPAGARDANTVRLLKETLSLLPIVFSSSEGDQYRGGWFGITLPIAGQDYHAIKSAAAALAPSSSAKAFVSSIQTAAVAEWSNSVDLQTALTTLSALEMGNPASAVNRASLMSIALYWSASRVNDQQEVVRCLLAIQDSRDPSLTLANAIVPLLYALASDLGQPSTQTCATLRTLLSFPFLQNLLFRCPSRSDGWIKTSEGQLEKYGTRLEMLYRIARTNAASTRKEDDEDYVNNLEAILKDLLLVAQRRAENVVSVVVGDDVATDEGYDAAEAVEVVQRLLTTVSKSKQGDPSASDEGAKPLTLAERFEAANKAFAAVAKKYPDDVKLRFYALFKQSTVGDVNTKRPWAMDFTGRAKWDAWDKLRGQTTTDAMTIYVEEWIRLSKTSSQ